MPVNGGGGSKALIETDREFRTIDNSGIILPSAGYDAMAQVSYNVYDTLNNPVANAQISNPKSVANFTKGSATVTIPASDVHMAAEPINNRITRVLFSNAFWSVSTSGVETGEHPVYIVPRYCDYSVMYDSYFCLFLICQYDEEAKNIMIGGSVASQDLGGGLVMQIADDLSSVSITIDLTKWKFFESGYETTKVGFPGNYMFTFI